MKEFFARLNPTERRFVVGVAVVFFLVINIVWVWPHFGDWSATRAKMDDASTKLALFESGTNLIPGLKKEIEKYQKQGELVPPVDQAVRFVRLIQNQTTLFGIVPESMSVQRQTGETNNPFFMNQTETMTMTSNEKQLVDFLYSLGAGTNSLIRVKALSVMPDGSHQRLTTRVTLVASYQKKAMVPASAAATPAAKRPVAEQKPAVTPVAPGGAPPVARGGIPPGVPTASSKPAGTTNRQLPTLLSPTGAVKILTPPKK